MVGGISLVGVSLDGEDKTLPVRVVRVTRLGLYLRTVLIRRSTC